jgi:hypothetical protein
MTWFLIKHHGRLYLICTLLEFNVIFYLFSECNWFYNYIKQTLSWQDIVAQLMKKFSVVYGTWRTITMFPRTYHWAQPWDPLLYYPLIYTQVFVLASIFRIVTSTLQTEAARSSETLVTTYKTTLRHNPEDHNKHLQLREKLTYQSWGFHSGPYSYRYSTDCIGKITDFYPKREAGSYHLGKVLYPEDSTSI